MTTVISHRPLLFARLLSIASFAAYACSQAHILSLPSPKFPKPYSPNDYFVVAFFAVSALLNAHWLRQLFFTRDHSMDAPLLSIGDDEESIDSKLEEKAALLSFSPAFYEHYDDDAYLPMTLPKSAQTKLLPFYIAGNLFLTAWSVAWFNGHYLLSQILLAGNLAAQFYAVFVVLQSEDECSITPSTYMTHIVMKTNAGLGMLYMWKNWGMIDQRMVYPSMAEMVNSGVIFLLVTIASGPDPILGICLIYDLAALIYGHTDSDEWYRAFHWIMVVVSVCLLVELELSKRRNFVWLEGFDDSITHRRKQWVFRDMAQDVSGSKFRVYPFVNLGTAPHQYLRRDIENQKDHPFC